MLQIAQVETPLNNYTQSVGADTQNTTHTPGSKNPTVPSLSDRYQLVNDDVNKLMRTYATWVAHETFISATNGETHITWRATKRGNDIYSRKVKKRLSDFNNTLPDMQFFNPDKALEDYLKLKKARRTNLYSHPKTPLLFLVLTVDRAKMNRYESWKLGPQINKIRSALSRKFKGKISIIRAPESHKDGYCHINLVVLLETPVKCFPHIKTNNLTGQKTVSWRIKEKHSLEKYWSHGYIDVQALATIKSYGPQEKTTVRNNAKMPLSHVFKYMTKDLRSRKSRNENVRSLQQTALLWATKTRSYSLSGKFKDLLTTTTITESLETYIETNSDLIENISVTQTKFKKIGIFPNCAGPCFKEQDRPPPENCPYLDFNKDHNIGCCSQTSDKFDILVYWLERDWLINMEPLIREISEGTEAEAREMFLKNIMGAPPGIRPKTLMEQRAPPKKKLLCEREVPAMLKQKERVSHA